MIGNAADFIAYAAARGVTVGEDEAPILLVKATDYMNTFEWQGNRPKGQEDSWPRENITVNGDALFNSDGDEITVIEHNDGTESELQHGDIIGSPPVTPQPIIIATYRVALAISDGADFQKVSGGAKVVQESVSGAVSVTYAEGTVSDAAIIPGFTILINEWLLAPMRSGINFDVMRS